MIVWCSDTYMCLLLFNRAPGAKLRSALWNYSFFKAETESVCIMLLSWANVDWKRQIASEQAYLLFMIEYATYSSITWVPMINLIPRI